MIHFDFEDLRDLPSVGQLQDRLRSLGFKIPKNLVDAPDGEIKVEASWNEFLRTFWNDDIDNIDIEVVPPGQGELTIKYGGHRCELCDAHMSIGILCDDDSFVYKEI